MSSAWIDPPDFKAYRDTRFLNLIQRVYCLERLDIGLGQTDAVKMPFFRSRLPGKRNLVFALPFQFYGAPVFSDESERLEHFKAIENYSRRTGHNVTFCSLRDEGYLSYVQTAWNPILYLSHSLDETRRGYSDNLISNLKRWANKAERAKLQLSISTDLTDLQSFYREVLAPQYVRKHRMVFQPWALYAGLAELGLARAVIARTAERIVGGLILVADERGLHYAWGASLNLDNIAIGALMLDFAIRLAIEEERKYFDFGSTSMSDVELLNFKLRWGTHNYAVRRYYTTNPPHVADLNNGYLFARRLYGKLPPAIPRMLMGFVVPWLVS